MLPRRCGTYQESSLDTGAAWWAVHPELVLADTLSAVPVVFTPSPSHSLVDHVSVAGTHLASETDNFPSQMGVLLINTFH